MSFKKVSLDEIKYAMYENLIGMPMDQKILSRENVKSSREMGSSRVFGGEKDGKSLLIICQRAENRTADTKGNTKEFQLEDFLTLKNTGEVDKLWNIGFQLSNVTKEFFVSELLPGEEWNFNLYESKNQKTETLEITERISKTGYVNEKDGKSDLFLQNNKINTFHFSIFATNKSPHSISDIFLIKNLPPTNIELVEAISFAGKINKYKKRINWEIEQIYPGETVVLNFKINLRPKPTNTGKIHVQYRVQIKDESFYTIKKFNSSLNATSLIDVKESEKFPGNWECTLSLLNRSEFLIDITSAKLFENRGKEKIDLYSSTTVEEISQDKEKILFKTSIEAKNHPYLMKAVKFHPQYELLTDYACNLYIDDDKMDLLELTAKKEFSVAEIKPQDRIPFESTIKIRNFSSLPINHLFIKDFIPKGFMIQDIGSLSLNNKTESIYLKDFQTDLISENSKEKYEELMQKMSKTDERIKFLSEENNRLDKTIANNAKIINQNKKDNSELLQKLNGIKTEIDESNLKKNKFSQEITDLQSQNKEKLVNLKNDKKNLQKLIDLKQKLKIKRELSDLKTETSINANEIKKEIKKLNQISSENLKKGEEIEKLINEKQELLTQSDLEPDVSKGIKKELKKLEKELKLNISEREGLDSEINNLSNQESEIRNKLKGIQQEVKKNAIPKKAKRNIDQVKSNIEETKGLINSSEEFIRLNQEQIENFEKEIKSIVSLVEKNEVLSGNIQQQMSEDSKNQEMYQKSTTQLSQNETEYTQLKIDYTKQSEQKEKLELVLNSTLGNEHIFSSFYSNFAKNRDSEEKVVFDAVNTSNFAGDQNLLITINNIQKIFSGNDNTFTIKYSLFTLNPNKTEYNFPCSVYFDTEPMREIQEYIVSEDDLPKITVLESRKDISVGKTVQRIGEEGKLRISLLIRNYGVKVIQDLEIIDILPRSSTILKTDQKYSENILNDEKKEVIWHLGKIMSNEDMEIKYLLEVVGEYNITDNELIVK